MLFCLNSRCSDKYLQQADQIKIEYRDRNSLPTVEDKFPYKPIIMEFEQEPTEKEYELIKHYNNITLSFGSYIIHNKYTDLPFFLKHPISSFAEIAALRRNGACAFYPGPGTFFNQNELQKMNFPARYVVNIPWLTSFSIEKNICGQYIRPEALKYYENDYIENVVEFFGILPSAEEALFRIYSEKKSFPGQLSYIISDLNEEESCENRMIPNQFDIARLNCGHKCQSGKNCHICPKTIQTANAVLDNYQNF